MLLDSVDEPDARRRAAPRGASCSRSAYVVDLAWLRSTPWRERVAATFDPAKLRPDLRTISARRRSATTPSPTAAALLLVGWLASRLGWQLSPLMPGADGELRGSAHGRRQDVALRLEPAPRCRSAGSAG